MKRVLLFIACLFMLHALMAQNPPVAVNDTLTINKNNSVMLPVLSNDYDLDGDPLTISVLTSPDNGLTTVSGGDIAYTPNQNFVGTDSFQYVICDSTSLCDTAWVWVVVTGNNNYPEASNDYFTIPENTATILPVTSNDQDPDGEPLSVSILNTPQHGSVSVINGVQILYTPAGNYYGTDTFSYVTCDTSALCDTAVVYVIISGSNGAPIANVDNFVFGDTLQTTVLDLLNNDTDPEGDSVFITTLIDIDLANNLGTFNLTSAGLVEFTRASLACGAETFQYVVCDVTACDTAEFSVTVNCPDDVFHTQGFSPDGDGLNDKLVFPGLEYFAPAILKIYNRYGNLVYESEDYKNDWEGSYMDNGKGLPDGTYFYILQLSNKRKYNNYLIINR